MLFQVSLHLLTGVIAEVRIVDFAAEVTLRQRFENTHSTPIEAVYDILLEPKVRGPASHKSMLRPTMPARGVRLQGRGGRADVRGEDDGEGGGAERV